MPRESAWAIEALSSFVVRLDCLWSETSPERVSPQLQILSANAASRDLTTR